MNELENKLNQGENFNTKSLKKEEIGFFIYKDFIISVYRLLPIIVENTSEGSFENVYVIYDTKTDKVFTEISNEGKELFEVLPEIDNVLFNYEFDNREIVEKSKMIIKEEVFKYYETKEISSRYVEELKKIYDFIDISSKEFYEFFIREVEQ